ncbi:TIGR04255 family protein [Candidatus Poribacteria bacterium]|nr:TIGR04255 family protein [Candidatus Poribacteria bacterium]
MSRKYKSPPIIEAFCEFVFSSDSPWDLTIPGLIYEKIRKNFPKRQQIRLPIIDIVGNASGINRLGVSTPERIRFLREDETAIIQVAQHLLVINHLTPYSSWKAFLPLIQKGFDTYWEVVEPKGIDKIRLSYINQIEFQPPVELEDYFYFYPFVGQSLPQDFNSFITGIENEYETDFSSLSVRLGSTISRIPDKVSMTLNLEYTLRKPGAVERDGVFEWLQVAHDRIEKTFEGCITDKLRKKFEEVTE